MDIKKENNRYKKIKDLKNDSESYKKTLMWKFSLKFIFYVMSNFNFVLDLVMTNVSISSNTKLLII